MYTLNQKDPINNFKHIKRAQRICPPFIKRFEVDKMDQRQGIKTADVIVRGICFNHHKPYDFQDFGDKENEFGADHNTPALRVRHAIAKHETADPDDKRYYRKFPQVDQRDRKELDGIDGL